MPHKNSYITVTDQFCGAGDIVADLFSGLGTTGRQAILKSRKAYLTELNDGYARCSNIYLRVLR